MTRKLQLLTGLLALVLPTVMRAAPAQLRTGASTAVDGYLEILPDEYGSWAQPFATGGFGPNADRYKPVGLSLQPVGFSSGLFLFAPNGQRELLSDNTDWQTMVPAPPGFSADTSLDRMILSPNVASDSNGDGINDTANSAFRVSGGATDLNFALQQRVASASGAVSFMQQTYTVTNNGAASLALNLVRAFDGDLLWSGTAANDQVGTTANGAGLGQFVVIRETSNNSTAITLSGGTQGHFYYGGKQNFTPPNGPPAYGFGTDVQVWDAFGIPGSWQNNIATIGYNTDGFSGAVTGTQDAFIGLDFLFNLAAGASVTFDVFHTYGQATPVPEPATLGLLVLAGMAVLRRRG
ncbi:MAG TPA: PEP-CTERM sorting domain-containing protein [Phycisphaerae bacterium]|jgi:hypothetical protein